MAEKVADSPYADLPKKVRQIIDRINVPAAGIHENGNYDPLIATRLQVAHFARDFLSGKNPMPVGAVVKLLERRFVNQPSPTSRG